MRFRFNGLPDMTTCPASINTQFGSFLQLNHSSCAPLIDNDSCPPRRIPDVAALFVSHRQSPSLEAQGGRKKPGWF